MEHAEAMLHDMSLLTQAHDDSKDTDELALVVLNYPNLSRYPLFFSNLWKLAKVRACADGGANRLYDAMSRNGMGILKQYIPEYIKGDLDSLRDDVRAFYAAEGCQIVQDSDQDTNDLDKTLQLLKDLQQVKNVKYDVVILGAMGGRFDQEMQNMNALYRWTCFRRMILISDQCLAFLLAPGKHVIFPNFDIESRVCGIIPLATPCRCITTAGLKWNLTKDTMQFGGLISSSNRIESSKVEIETSDAIIWTTQI